MSLSFDALDIGQVGGSRNPLSAKAFVRVQVGGLEQDRAEFSFPGVDGVFELLGGLRGRAIVWNATILACSEAELAEIIAESEAYVAEGGEYAMSAHGRSFSSCVLRHVAPRGDRRRIRPVPWVMQEVQFVFQEMSGGY